jgi:hypothetical protein
VPPKQLVFHQPLPRAEGLLRSIAEVLDIAISIPDHTTLSRAEALKNFTQPRNVGA